MSNKQDVADYRARRAKRLSERGIMPHPANFPAGLLRKHGIRPTAQMTVHNAWEALKGKADIAELYRAFKAAERGEN